jgi:3-dehydroquinate dehydratase II
VIAVLNGVNLNLLGRRDPELYGSLTLSNLESKIYKWSRESGTTARCFQTNHEGSFVDNLHEAVGWATHGMAVNPGAWTHYSYAIRDAIEYVVQQGVEVVEVHLSDIDAREDFRRHSVLSDVVSHRIKGEGPDGYRLAIEWLTRESSTIG